MGRKCSRMYPVVDGCVSEEPEQVRSNEIDTYIPTDEPTDPGVHTDVFEQSGTRPPEVASRDKCAMHEGKNDHRKPDRPLGWQRGTNKQRHCHIAQVPSPR